MKRRNFIRSGALAIAGFTILPRHILGGTNFVVPSDQINLGIIGCGAQGRWTLGPEFARRANLIAASDCESRQLNAMQAIVEKETETCRAGKDVYVEKPMSHSIEEGRAMADAVAKYNRVLQVGNMQRSWRNFRHACELVRNGYIGEIKEVKVSIGPPPVKYDLPAQPVPKTLNWDMWIGPAPMNVYNEELAPPMERNMFPNWRNYREYGGGMICDWGAHMFDIAQWALGMDDSGPIEFTPPDEGELRPLSMRYANGTIMTHEPFRKADGNAVRFIGSDGVIDISRSFLDTIPAKLQDEVIGDDKIKLYKSDDHYNDFLTAMKTRKQPLSTVEIGHRTASLCHIVNLCYEFDRKLVWNPEKEEFFFDNEANKRRGNPIREPYSLKV